MAQRRRAHTPYLTLRICSRALRWSRTTSSQSRVCRESSRTHRQRAHFFLIDSRAVYSPLHPCALSSLTRSGERNGLLLRSTLGGQKPPTHNLPPTSSVFGISTAVTPEQAGGLEALIKGRFQPPPALHPVPYKHAGPRAGLRLMTFGQASNAHTPIGTVMVQSPERPSSADTGRLDTTFMTRRGSECVVGVLGSTQRSAVPDASLTPTPLRTPVSQASAR